MCREFIAGPGPTVLQRLDELEGAATEAGASAAGIHQLFTRICDQLDHESSREPRSARRTLRPILLDLLLRLFVDNRAR